MPVIGEKDTFLINPASDKKTACCSITRVIMGIRSGVCDGRNHGDGSQCIQAGRCSGRLPQNKTESKEE